jgi:hypothetical protein
MMVLGAVSTSLSAISTWIWVPTYLYAYYLGIVLPLWYIASRTFNDDPSVGGALSSSSSSKTSKTSPSWPILQVSIRSFITITLLIVLSSVFYVPLYYMQKLEGDHVLALFFLGAIASFMNARMIQLIAFTPISTRRSWSIVRLFCECTSIIETLEPSVVGGKRKAKKVVIEDEAEEEEEDSQAKV